MLSIDTVARKYGCHFLKPARFILKKNRYLFDLHRSSSFQIFRLSITRFAFPMLRSIVFGSTSFTLT